MRIPVNVEGLDPTAEAELDTRAAELESRAVDPAPCEPASEPDRATLTRALRELEASKARVERDAQQAQDEMRRTLVTQLLPLLDNLDRTIEAAELSGDSPAVVEGVRLVRNQFQRVLEGYGVERIDATHARFDPAQHEAVSTVPVTEPAAHGRVIEQLAPGYRFADRLLRPARVAVGRHVPRYH
jgi:molecular chaperone GrpE (heat shock protein)